MAYTAIAITPDHEVMAFGPDFTNEDDAWKWLHSDSICCPLHRYIDVIEQQAIDTYEVSMPAYYPCDSNECPF
jgi:hypothetical protein